MGTIAVNSRRGVNLIRFNGRLGKRWLLDGTYVLATPTMRIRFAVVAGRPTRKKTRLQPSTCREGVEVLLAGGSVPLGSASAGAADGETVPVTEAGGITDVGAPRVLPTGQSGPSRVLGTTIDSVKSVVTGLHPAFYLLLGMAIAALATATLPASAVPSPWLGATLARRRAELTRRHDGARDGDRGVPVDGRNLNRLHARANNPRCEDRTDQGMSPSSGNASSV